MNNNVPLYRFENHPDLTELVPPETDEPNIYGAVVYKQGEVRHRFDGVIRSEWEGRVLVRTTEHPTKYNNNRCPVLSPRSAIR
jgi:hypothetical protein